MFVKRLMSSVFLILITLVVILAGGPALAAVLLFISEIAFFELTKATGIHHVEKKMNGLELVGGIGIIAYYAAMFYTGNTNLLCFVIVLIFLMVMFVYVFSFPKFSAQKVMSTFFSIIYAPVLLSFIYMTRELEQGIYTVWMIFISSWICDTCAYLVGVMLGKHKMAPKLSPKKSIEGAVGGVVGAAAVGALFGYIMWKLGFGIREVIPAYAVIGAIGAIISQVGDLAASAIKRDHNMKDYGNLIPGHGGIMDRFDSVIFAAPMIYFLAIYLI